MPLAVAPGLLLLLLASGARGALEVSVPTSRVQAPPGSDVLLGCHFSVGGAVDLTQLVVQWKLGTRLVAEFDNDLSYPKAGASLSLEGLRGGNATLLLPQVRDADAGLYTCMVIVPPSRESREVELRVEAPPRVSVSGTAVRAGELGIVTCSVSSFHPWSVTVSWLRGDEVVGGPETPPAQLGPDGLYSATSNFRLLPSIPDADTTYSCHVSHVALGAPIQETFRLHVLARPRLMLKTVVMPEGLGALQVWVTGYYPPNITVQWLRDGAILPSMESQPTRELDGSFALRSSYILDRPESDTRVPFVCRVQHPALATPLERTVTWEVPTCPRLWLWVLGIIALVLFVLLLGWIWYQCCYLSMSPIYVWECFPRGRVTALCCEVEGRVSPRDTLAWARQGQRKELGPGQTGELSALTSEQYQVETWRSCPRLGNQRLTSVLTVQTPSVEETFSCMFRPGARGTRQRIITIPGVPAVSPDSCLSSL